MDESSRRKLCLSSYEKHAYFLKYVMLTARHMNESWNKSGERVDVNCQLYIGIACTYLRSFNDSTLAYKAADRLNVKTITHDVISFEES